MIVGPGKDGAILEGSKDFAKQFMIRHCSLHWKHATIIQKQVLPIHLAVRQQL